MTNFERGDVVLVDLGYAAKIRPCVVISIPDVALERNMSIVAPMTTEIRGGKCEVRFPKPPWLREESVINVIGVTGVDNIKIVKRLASFPPKELNDIYLALASAFGVRLAS